MLKKAPVLAIDKQIECSIVVPIVKPKKIDKIFNSQQSAIIRIVVEFEGLLPKTEETSWWHYPLQPGTLIEGFWSESKEHVVAIYQWAIAWGKKINA